MTIPQPGSPIWRHFEGLDVDGGAIAAVFALKSLRVDDAGEVIDGEAHVCWRNGETLLVTDVCVIGPE